MCSSKILTIMTSLLQSQMTPYSSSARHTFDSFLLNNGVRKVAGLTVKKAETHCWPWSWRCGEMKLFICENIKLQAVTFRSYSLNVYRRTKWCRKSLPWFLKFKYGWKVLWSWSMWFDRYIGDHMFIPMIDWSTFFRLSEYLNFREKI